MSKVIVISVLILLASCGETYQPLPIGQMRIALPDHEYKEESGNCPYTMEIPVYSEVNIRTAPDGNCWSDLRIPGMRAVIHLTYRKLFDDLARTLDETHELTYGHVSMADNIEDESVLFPDRNVYGTVYDISGNVASNIQFYATDSVDHFLRGALYFDAPPNKDSLAPVVAHLREDIAHLLQTLSWKE